MNQITAKQDFRLPRKMHYEQFSGKIFNILIGL